MAFIKKSKKHWNTQLFLRVLLIGMYINFPMKSTELDISCLVGRVWLLRTDLILVVCIFLPVKCFSFYGPLMECLSSCQKIWHMTFGSTVLANAWKFSINTVIRRVVFYNRFASSLATFPPLTALRHGAVIVSDALPESADGGVWLASSSGMLARRSWWCSCWSTQRMINTVPSAVFDSDH